MSKRDEYAQEIIWEGQRLGITPRGIVIALATALVESNLVMYANHADPESLKYPHERLSTDKNSSGLFQQRAPWWGTAADRMSPAGSARLFYEALAGYAYNNPARSPGFYAQQVQRSAFPDRYDQRMPEAQQIYDRLGNVTVTDKPAFTEIDRMTGGGRSPRSRPPVNFLLHTEEGNSSAESLARYCNGSNGVSYHYTVRDGIVANVVDTDFASWSVLDANAFTINLCFAGSRSSWSRAEWLARERDIEIAAYLAVQDCRKYGIPTTVIKPPYHESAGISDHRYVTDCLGIGNHTDVGPNFPWDVFEKYVNKYAGVTGGSEDNMSWGEIIQNHEGQDTSREDMIKWIDTHTIQLLRVGIAILDQLAGAGVGEKVANGEVAEFNGFSQGGKRSAYDLLAAVAAALKVSDTKDMRGSK